MFAYSLKAFETSLNFIGLIGLVLDAVGALLVLGPDIELIAKWSTYQERFQMRHLFAKLQSEGELDDNTSGFQHFVSLVEESWGGGIQFPFDIEVLKIEDGRVVFGARGLEDGERSSTPIDEFPGWISAYRGTEREFYRAGAGLLLVGFLFQMVVQSARIDLIFGLIFLGVPLGTGVYMLYRGGAIEYIKTLRLILEER